MPSKANREILTERVVDFPQRLVYAAWTDPAHLSRWWGPKGFTNTFHEFDLRPGGSWRFTMHAPGGHDFENVCRFVEVVSPHRLVFDHIEPVHLFRVTAEFTPRERGTHVRLHMLFDSAEECARVREIITEKNEENMDRLEAELARMSPT